MDESSQENLAAFFFAFFCRSFGPLQSKYVATQVKHTLVELAGNFSTNDSFNLFLLEMERKLSEQRKEGWELVSTGLSIWRLSSPLTYSYAIRVTYALKRPVAKQ